MNSDNKFKKIIQNQRKDIRKSGNYSKMGFRDLKRLASYVEGDIFEDDDCVRYTGELKKNTAIFSFKGKKVSLHRLLYHNFCDHITRSDIIQFRCPLKGSSPRE